MRRSIILQNCPRLWFGMGRKNFLVFQVVDSADLSHTHPNPNKTPNHDFFFPPPNLIVVGVNLEFMQIPTGLLQCLRRWDAIHWMIHQKNLVLPLFQCSSFLQTVDFGKYQMYFFVLFCLMVGCGPGNPLQERIQQTSC